MYEGGDDDDDDDGDGDEWSRTHSGFGTGAVCRLSLRPLPRAASAMCIALESFLGTVLCTQ